MATASPVADLATCPICFDLFEDAKTLPCLHAVCLRCLQGLCRDMLPGDTETCPKCRKTFQIPQNGVDSLQCHFIVQRLADKERERIRLQSFCDEHKDEQQRMYCYDCKDNICLICLRKKHRSHNWDFIPEVADIFRLRIHDDVQQVQSATSSVREKAELDATKFCSEVEAVKKQILAMDDITKRSVDNQVSDLLTKLQMVNSESSKQVENVKLASFTKVEEFYTDLQKLLDAGRSTNLYHWSCL